MFACVGVLVGALVGVLEEFGYAQWFLFFTSTCQYSFVFLLILVSLPIQDESYRQAIAVLLLWRIGPIDTTACLPVGFSFGRFLFLVSYLPTAL